MKESLIIESYLNLLVSENSDISLLEYKWYVINIRSFVWKLGRWLTFYVSYNSIPVELCTVQKIERGFWLKADTNYTVEYKWQYFRLEESGYFDKWFYKTFSDYLFNWENPDIIRIDRICDFFLKENTKDKNYILWTHYYYYEKIEFVQTQIQKQCESERIIEFSKPKTE